MPTDKLIAILEEIRDQQKQQIANFERAVAAQNEAAAIQRRGRRIMLFLVLMPWVALLAVFVLLVSHVLMP